MFLKLTNEDNPDTSLFINADHIACLEKGKYSTLLVLCCGVRYLIKETPEEVAGMMNQSGKEEREDV